MDTHTRVNTKGCPFHASAETISAAEAFDMFADEYQASPAKSLKRFREEKPIFFSEAMNYWVVTRFQDLKDGLNNQPADPNSSLLVA